MMKTNFGTHIVNVTVVSEKNDDPSFTCKQVYFRFFYIGSLNFTSNNHFDHKTLIRI